VSLTLDMRAFAAYDDVRRAWVAEAGRFEVRLGSSSADIGQRAWITLATDWVEPINYELTHSTIGT
jgi:beta-glucosidase